MTGAEWTAPEAVRVNQTDARSLVIPFDDAESAKEYLGRLFVRNRKQKFSDFLSETRIGLRKGFCTICRICILQTWRSVWDIRRMDNISAGCLY